MGRHSQPESQPVQKRSYWWVAIASAPAVILAGVGVYSLTGSDFIDAARDRGVVIHDESSMRSVVESICDSMDQGNSAFDSVLNASIRFNLSRELSSDDPSLIASGVESECSNHSVELSRVTDQITQNRLMADEITTQAESPTQLTWNSDHQFSDGVQIKVTQPKPYTRTKDDMRWGSCTSNCPTKGHQVTITITNNSQAAVDVNSIWGEATVGGQPAPALAFDPAPEGKLRGKAGTLLPGQSQSAEELYWFDGSGDKVIHINYNSEEVYYHD